MKLSETRIHVADFAAMFHFYQDTLGLPVLWGDEGSGYAAFGSEACNVSIFPWQGMAEAAGSGFAYRPGAQDRVMIAIGVDDVDATYAALRGRGVEAVDRPQDQPGWGMRVAHLRDPEGNLIEINQPLPQ